MPRTSNRKIRSENALSQRWANKRLEKSPETAADLNDSEYSMEIDEREKDTDSNSIDFSTRLDLPAIGDLFQLCKRSCGSRKLSVLLYMILRHVGISWRETDVILAHLGAYRTAAAHQWAETFISGDIDSLDDEGRGGKHCESLFDMFPELETKAKAFAIDACSRKTADFTVSELANFIDGKFYEITDTVKVTDSLVHSIESCRLDLRRWGVKFQANSQRPYFEGHERADVVAHRQEFVTYFQERKDRYYTITEGEQPARQTPGRNPTVLICKYLMLVEIVSKKFGWAFSLF